MERMPKTNSKDGLSGRFTPSDFDKVLLNVPADCPVVGGQAVAWWVEKYRDACSIEPVTSVDLDFWGSRDDLKALGRKLNIRPVFPHEYDMTLWVGALPMTINGEKTVVEFLHSIPGLDTNDPNRASVEQEYSSGQGNRVISILSPVSLVLTKLHALRHFEQKDRNDELHLVVSLQASRAFILQLIRQGAIRETLWNCERLIHAHQLKASKKVEKKFGFDLLSAIPIEEIKHASTTESIPSSDRKRLGNFWKIRWLNIKD